MDKMRKEVITIDGADLEVVVVLPGTLSPKDILRLRTEYPKNKIRSAIVAPQSEYDLMDTEGVLRHAIKKHGYVPPSPIMMVIKEDPTKGTAEAC